MQWSTPEPPVAIPKPLKQVMVTAGIPEFEMPFVAEEMMTQARLEHPDAEEKFIIGVACGLLF